MRHSDVSPFKIVYHLVITNRNLQKKFSSRRKILSPTLSFITQDTITRLRKTDNLVWWIGVETRLTVTERLLRAHIAAAAAAGGATPLPTQVEHALYDLEDDRVAREVVVDEVHEAVRVAHAVDEAT